MTGGIDEILGRKDKIIIGAMILFLFALMALLNFMGYFENKERDAVLQTEFAGTVTQKYTDRQEHNNPILKLSNGMAMLNYFPGSNTDINIGDSLVKPKNSTNMLVYRKKQLTYSINLLRE